MGWLDGRSFPQSSSVGKNQVGEVLLFLFFEAPCFACALCNAMCMLRTELWMAQRRAVEGPWSEAGVGYLGRYIARKCRNIKGTLLEAALLQGIHEQGTL